MRAKVSNTLNGLTLVGLGSVFVLFYLNGRIDQYLNPIFRPLVMIAGDCIHRHINNPAWSLAFFGVICLSVLTGATLSTKRSLQTKFAPEPAHEYEYAKKY